MKKKEITLDNERDSDSRIQTADYFHPNSICFDQVQLDEKTHRQMEILHSYQRHSSFDCSMVNHLRYHHHLRPRIEKIIILILFQTKKYFDLRFHSRKISRLSHNFVDKYLCSHVLEDFLFCLNLKSTNEIQSSVSNVRNHNFTATFFDFSSYLRKEF